MNTDAQVLLEIALKKVAQYCGECESVFCGPGDCELYGFGAGISTFNDSMSAEDLYSVLMKAIEAHCYDVCASRQKEGCLQLKCPLRFFNHRKIFNSNSKFSLLCD